MSRKIGKEGNYFKRKYKLDKTKLIYSDLNQPANTLFSKNYRIYGRPDYIVKDREKYIPVEIKTGHYTKPKKNHILQLAAYCHLVEENYNSFVPYGYLIYQNQSSIKIPFDPALRYELESIIKNMRGDLRQKKVMRNHKNSKKCLNCSMRKYCNNKIIS